MFEQSSIKILRSFMLHIILGLLPFYVDIISDAISLYEYWRQMYTLKFGFSLTCIFVTIIARIIYGEITKNKNTNQRLKEYFLAFFFCEMITKFVLIILLCFFSK